MAGSSELSLRRQHTQSHQADSACNSAAFWLLGLINNSAYVIMIAGANEISSGAIGYVYLAAILPSLCLKLTCPYWFHAVGYELRVWIIAVLMSVAYITVAMSSSRSMQLLGVAFGSAQAGLGEASCLALCALYDARRSLTCWSSGTGFAGVFGYAWVTVLHLWGGMPFSRVLLAANASSIAWLWAYYGLLQKPQQHGSHWRLLEEPAAPAAAVSMEPEAAALLPGGLASPASSVGGAGGSASAAAVHDRRQATQAAAVNWPSSSSNSGSSEGELHKGDKPLLMTLQRRFQVTCSLWPYIVPLATVYAAEYAMQSGTWTAIGFPITDADARHRFYQYANWAYQMGVFISRSSGLLFQAGRKSLWAMPALQCLLLVFFSIVAAYHWPLYNNSLLVPAFVVGLLGGAVYVNAFTLISKEVEPGLQEFALAATSVGDSIGTAVADAAGVLIQGCMFRVNGLQGADFKCGS